MTDDSKKGFLITCHTLVRVMKKPSQRKKMAEEGKDRERCV